MQCPLVSPSVTFVHAVKTNKHIFKIFSSSGSHTILVFPHQTLRQYSDRNPRNGGIECRWGRQKSRFSTNIWLHRLLSTVLPPNVIQTAAPNRGKLVTLIAGSSNRRRLLFSLYDDNVFMTRSLNVTPKTTEQNLIVRICKSEAKVTNNKRLRSRYCAVEANYWDTKHREASLLLVSFNVVIQEWINHCLVLKPCNQ